VRKALKLLALEKIIFPFFLIIDKKIATFHTCRTYILNETKGQMAEIAVKREREREGKD
jgi:hypothetical protein